ncbi:type II toxin-antitoxin system antitoxin, RelB/DinJ family [Helicobacter didelphidarum]|uniref:Type II toxin-antitoxin system antitoxin, RelB/DinJ family n=1 Tax=Helicobacter didelphidarum TaxID=2040648 RepID=A0A3D8IL34_9HELI|nr:type II toxin-antitoxin system RelB/DinJ family antitoxin [Helicobacter didelphidarum]RDU65281.1 type II toxin-antitoxin system antitoxin, RelB/DinJ family [Helicobacter didelphidarum]
MQTQMMNVTFRMSKEDKQHFERIINSMGLNLSSAFNIFAKAVIRENAIPFELRGDEIPNAETIKTIENIENEENLETITIEQLIKEREEMKAHEKIG